MMGKKKARIAELENLCGEIYQVIDNMSYNLGIYDTEEINRIKSRLTQASYGEKLKDNSSFLPFSTEEIQKKHATKINPWGYHVTFNAARGLKEIVTNSDRLITFTRTLTEKLNMTMYSVPNIVINVGYNSMHQTGETSMISGQFIGNSGDFYLDIFSYKPFNIDVARQYIFECLRPIAMDTCFLIRRAPYYGR